MFNKGNCPVPSQLPASHCSGKPFSNMRWMSLEATSRRRRILLAGFCFIGISANCVPKNTLQKRCQKKQKQYLCYPFQCCQVWNLYCSEA